MKPQYVRYFICNQDVTPNSKVRNMNERKQSYAWATTRQDQSFTPPHWMQNSFLDSNRCMVVFKAKVTCFSTNCFTWKLHSGFRIIVSLYTTVASTHFCTLTLLCFFDHFVHVIKMTHENVQFHLIVIQLWAVDIHSMAFLNINTTLLFVKDFSRHSQPKKTPYPSVTLCGDPYP